MPTIKELSYALLNSWGADTATKGIWKEEIPDLNQCAITALVVQDYFGGDLLRCPLNDGDSHYWNNTKAHGELDLTFTQFAYTKQRKMVGTPIIREREYVLSFPDTLKRYEILSERVKEYLKNG
jgi:hypothetical protein